MVTEKQERRGSFELGEKEGWKRWKKRERGNRYAGAAVEDGEYWKCVPSTVGIEIERQEMWEK